MDIRLMDSITIRNLSKDYFDDGDGGVTGYGGRLDIRPPYQREFVYKDRKREAVIETVLKGHPLNSMYWAVRDDGTFEVMDGQQRTISICQFVENAYSVLVDGKRRDFNSLPTEDQKRILDYPLTVYQCAGTADEKLEWFQTINVQGEVLTQQELRNAVFAGPWVADAKRYFSKPGGSAVQIGSDFVNVDAIRQGYLETAIKWAKGSSKDEDIVAYMRDHQHDRSAIELKAHFKSVIRWAAKTFPTKRKNRKYVDWGALYAAHGHRDDLDPVELEESILLLEMDEAVTKPQGIFEYLLDSDERHLSRRSFSREIKQRVFAKQERRCADPACTKTDLTLDDVDADHIIPWSKGGKTTEDNCQVFCKHHNRSKGRR